MFASRADAAVYAGIQFGEDIIADGIIVVDGNNYARTTAGVEAAIAALGSTGGQVFLTCGSYAINDVLDITKSNVSITGEGLCTVLRLADSTNMTVILVSGATHVTIENLKIDGNNSNQTVSVHGINFASGSDYSLVDRVHITATEARCIDFDESDYGIVQNSRLEDCGELSGQNTARSAVGINSSDGVKIVNNLIDTPAGAGVYLGIGADTAPDQYLISGNTFINVHQDGELGGTSAIHGDQVAGGVISENICRDFPDTAHGVNCIFMRGTSGTADSRVIVSNNWADQITGVCVELQGGASIIEGNRCEMIGEGEDANAIYISSNDDYTIINANYIDSPYQAGIALIGDVDNVTITNNIIKNSNTKSAILFNPGAGQVDKHILIANNQLFDDQETPTQSRGIAKIGSGTLEDVIMFNNYMAGNTTGDINSMPSDGLVKSHSNIGLMGGNSTNSPFSTELRFYEQAPNGSNYIGFKAASSLSGDVIWTLPIADAVGLIQSNGSGTLSISNVLSGTVSLDGGTGAFGFKADGSVGGCLMLRDTDDAGWTECCALDGVLSCAIDADGTIDGTL